MGVYYGQDLVPHIMPESWVLVVSDGEYTVVKQTKLSYGGADVTITTTAPEDEYYQHLVAQVVPPAVTVARSIAQEDTVFIDAGANLGACALFFSKFSPSGRVLAFEPGSRAYADLRRSIELNALTNISCFEVALGAEDGEAVLLVPTWNASGAFIARDDRASQLHAKDGRVTTTVVPVRSIDSIVDELGIDRVDFLKIDVEGHERAVLEGAKRTLAEFDPMVVVEFNVFTISVFASTSPLEFLLDLMERFPHVTAIDGRLRAQSIVDVNDAYTLTHRCFLRGDVVDLICTSRPLPASVADFIVAGQVLLADPLVRVGDLLSRALERA